MPSVPIGGARKDVILLVQEEGSRLRRRVVLRVFTHACCVSLSRAEAWNYMMQQGDALHSRRLCVADYCPSVKGFKALELMRSVVHINRNTLRSKLSSLDARQYECVNEASWVFRFAIL